MSSFNLNKSIYIFVLFVMLFLAILGYYATSWQLIYFGGNIYLMLPIILLAVFLYRIFALNKYFFDLVGIFCISFLIFFCGRVLGYYFIELDPFFVSSLVVEVLSRNLMDKISFIAIISVCIILVIDSLFSEKIGGYRLFLSPNTDVESFKIGRLIFLISFPLMLIKMYYEFSYISQVGYLSIYVDGLKNVNYPVSYILFTIAYYFFISGFYLIVSAYPSYGRFIFYGVLFLVVSLFDSLKGGRANLAIPILFIIWWSFHAYNKRISLFSAFVFFLIVATFFGYLGSIRLDESIDLGGAAISFVTSQGNSSVVMALREIYAFDFERYSNFTLFTNLLIPYFYLFFPDVYSQPQSINLIGLAGGFKHILTYIINPEYYLSGGGLGSFYLAELYEFGIVGVIVGSFVAGLAMSWIAKYRSARMVGFFSFFIFSHIFLMPRAEFFPNSLAIIKLYLLYILFVSLPQKFKFFVFFSNRT